MALPGGLLWGFRSHAAAHSFIVNAQRLSCGSCRLAAPFTVGARALLPVVGDFDEILDGRCRAAWDDVGGHGRELGGWIHHGQRSPFRGLGGEAAVARRSISGAGWRVDRGDVPAWPERPVCGRAAPSRCRRVAAGDCRQC